MNQDLINKVYLEARKLQDSSLSEIEITEKLISMGFPAEISATASKDIQIERTLVQIKKGRERIQIGVVVTTMGILAAIGSHLYLESRVIVPMGIILTGIALLFSGLIGVRSNR